MDLDYAVLGKRIRDARLEKRMTQEELAQAVDCNISHISNIENNRTKVSLPTLLNICNALDTTIDSVMSDQYENAATALDHEILKRLQHYDNDRKQRYLKILELL